MRISDWSSDVCSSDLHLIMTGRLLLRDAKAKSDPNQRVAFKLSDGRELRFTDQRMFGWVELLGEEELGDFRLRSEEHTSELQSLMRISYAVFCLKQKININKLL